MSNQARNDQRSFFSDRTSPQNRTETVKIPFGPVQSVKKKYIYINKYYILI